MVRPIRLDRDVHRLLGKFLRIGQVALRPSYLCERVEDVRNAAIVIAVHDAVGVQSVP